MQNISLQKRHTGHSSAFGWTKCRAQWLMLASMIPQSLSPRPKLALGRNASWSPKYRFTEAAPRPLQRFWLDELQSTMALSPKKKLRLLSSSPRVASTLALTIWTIWIWAARCVMSRAISAGRGIEAIQLFCTLRRCGAVVSFWTARRCGCDLGCCDCCLHRTASHAQTQ